MFSEIEVKNHTINTYKSNRKTKNKEKALHDTRNWAEGFFVDGNISESPNYAKRNQDIIDRTLDELRLDDHS